MDEIEFHGEPPSNIPTMVVAFGNGSMPERRRRVPRRRTHGVRMTLTRSSSCTSWRTSCAKSGRGEATDTPHGCS
jgi:hypothetical protein